jgi:hypothetical protein
MSLKELLLKSIWLKLINLNTKLGSSRITQLYFEKAILFRVAFFVWGIKVFLFFIKKTFYIWRESGQK